MGDGHSEDGQFVGFPGQCAAGRHHVTKFIDVRGHLIPSPPLNLTMTLPTWKYYKSYTLRILHITNFTYYKFGKSILRWKELKLLQIKFHSILKRSVWYLCPILLIYVNKICSIHQCFYWLKLFLRWVVLPMGLLLLDSIKWNNMKFNWCLWQSTCL